MIVLFSWVHPKLSTDLATIMDVGSLLVMVLHISKGRSIAKIRANPAGIPACPNTITSITIPTVSLLALAMVAVGVIPSWVPKVRSKPKAWQ